MKDYSIQLSIIVAFLGLTVGTLFSIADTLRQILMVLKAQ